MKKILMGMVLAVLAASCVESALVIKGSGKVANGAFDVTLDYTGLSVASGITVNLVDSETGEGLISADEALLDYVSIVQEGGLVSVSYKPRISIRTGSIKTVVTMPLSPALTGIKASSSSKITYEGTLSRPSEKMTVNCTSSADVILSGIEARSLDLHVSSSGDMELANIKTGELKAHLSSSADCTLYSVSCDTFDISVGSSADFEVNSVSARGLHAEITSSGGCKISGTADSGIVRAGSSGDFNGYGLVCRTVEAAASSSGTVEITATESIDAKASSSGSVRYRGDARAVKSNSSSGGSVRNVN